MGPSCLQGGRGLIMRGAGRAPSSRHTDTPVSDGLLRARNRRGGRAWPAAHGLPLEGPGGPGLPRAHVCSWALAGARAGQSSILNPDSPSPSAPSSWTVQVLCLGWPFPHPTPPPADTPGQVCFAAKTFTQQPTPALGSGPQAHKGPFDRAARGRAALAVPLP